MENKQHIPLFFEFGARGTSPTPKQRFMDYGGNTNSFGLITPDETVVFLDAGTGIKYALGPISEHLSKPLEEARIYIALSHTHLDHIDSLAFPGEDGYPPLTHLRTEIRKKLIGPAGFMVGLEQLYDGVRLTPVGFDKFVNFDLENPINVTDNSCFPIDDSTTMTSIIVGHPVETGCALFRFDTNYSGRIASLVYATDTEFDWKLPEVPNDKVDLLIKKYGNFIRDADLLVADAQFSDEQYARTMSEGGRVVTGYGHTYPERIIEIAAEYGVKNLILSHHDVLRTDEISEDLEGRLKAKGSEIGLKVVLSREERVTQLDDIRF